MTLDAERIRAFLSKSDKSPEWLADQLGVSFALVTRMLAGRVPKTGTVVTLARVIGCRVEDLVIQGAAKQTA